MAVRHDEPVLTQPWIQHWSSNADQPVLTDFTSGRVLTASSVLAQSAAAAAALVDAGVAAGDRFVFAATPSADAAVAVLAALRLGAVPVLVDSRSTTVERAHAIEMTQARLVLTDQLDGWSLPVLDVHASNEGHCSKPLDVGRPHDEALICFTSGTTGRPKGVPHTRASLAAGLTAIQRAWRWTSTDTLVSALPLFHVHGLIVALLGSFHAGGHIVLVSKFRAEDAAEAVSVSQASMFFAVPTMWWSILEAGCGPAFRGLRLATSGSAPLDPTLARRLVDVLGELPVERYGMSETLMLTTNPLSGVRKVGSVGRPFPGVQLRLAEDGEVLVRGESVISHYLRGESAKSFDTDGWFHTGDLGRFDEDGYLQLVARKSDLIITGGHNVAPAEVEQVIAAHPAVVEVAVVGVPDEKWGEAVAAVIVAREDHEMLAELQDLCERSLAHYRRPRIWRFVDELPRTALGKIARHRIRVDDVGVVIE